MFDYFLDFKHNARLIFRYDSLPFKRLRLCAFTLSYQVHVASCVLELVDCSVKDSLTDLTDCQLLSVLLWHISYYSKLWVHHYAVVHYVGLLDMLYRFKLKTCEIGNELAQGSR